MKTNPLKTWRDSRQLSQGELAAMIGVKAMTVSRWERGDHFPNKKHWQSIEDTTGIAPSQLIAHMQADGAAQ